MLATGTRDAVDVLVRDRRGVPQHAERGRDLQLAGVVDAEAVGTAVREADVRRRGAGTDVELVLQDARLLAQAQVDARPQVAVDHVAVLRDARLPLARIAAAQIVDDAGGALGALRLGLRVLVDELQGEGDLLGCLQLLRCDVAALGCCFENDSTTELGVMKNP